eukprot:m.142284 g.142284  ORF g.142284 m.142284 type:complete len:272 (-) comp52614_c2_seq1:338-1153(-)
MEFAFNVNALVRDVISVWTADTLRATAPPPVRGKPTLDDRHAIIDAMGEASARAQKLHNVITTATKLLASDHRLYIMKQPDGDSRHGKVVGILRVGTKKLFVLDNSEKLREISPLCVLDFYVHESCQRTGFGKNLFEEMLKREATAPSRLAYDRPSPKLLGFLKKHYALEDFRIQTNNYVVFRQFFNPDPVPSNRASSPVFDRALSYPNPQATAFARSSSLQSASPAPPPQASSAYPSQPQSQFQPQPPSTLQPQSFLHQRLQQQQQQQQQ